MSWKKPGSIFLFSFLLVTAQSQSSIPPAHGTGSQSDPYQIATLENLCWLSQLDYYWDTYFVQTTDIDASATLTWNDGKGFYPIGDDYRYFDGHYDGKGHIIRNLYINQSTLYSTGFFGATFFASVENLGLINCSITGGNSTGGIIGQGWQTNLSNCFTSGTISGTNGTGGIVGNIRDGSLVNCFSNATVAGDNYAGGLIGYCSHTEMSHCYSSGTVTANNTVGGFIGLNSELSRISNCYATGTVTGNNYTGGFVGINDMSSTISNCYASGKVLSISFSTGGFAGFNFFSSINESFWNTETSGYILGIGYNEEGTTNSLTGLITDEMKSQIAFAGWDFESIWGIIENGSYPALKGVWNNAPFGYTDTICTRNSIKLSNLLINDFDYETSQDSLLVRICSLSAGSYNRDSLYIPDNIHFGDIIIIEYQPGELFSEGSDTLWGSMVKSILIYGNNAPELLWTANITLAEDTRHVFTWNDVRATDKDGDQLSIKIASGEHYTFHADTLIPDADFNGTLTVNLTVDDGLDTSRIKTIQVDVIAVNDAPVVNDITGETIENDTIVVEVTASDIDGTIRSIVIGNDPQHGSARHSGMTITYIPDIGFTGNDSLTFYAIDNGNLLSSPAKFLITVSMGNHAPEITSQAPMVANRGEEYIYTISASDVNLDSLIYFLTNAPENMSVSAEGIVTWIPGENVGTSGNVILHVSDGEFEDTETFSITVSGLSPNEKITKPIINLYPNPCNNGFYVETGAEKSSMLYIYDMDGRLVHTQPAMGVSWIDISHLKGGSYIVSIHSVRLHLIKN